MIIGKLQVPKNWLSVMLILALPILFIGSITINLHNASVKLKIDASAQGINKVGTISDSTLSSNATGLTNENTNNTVPADTDTSYDDIKKENTLTRDELLRRGGPDLPNGYVPSDQDIQLASYSIIPSSANVVLNEFGIASITIAGDGDKLIDSISFSGYDTSLLKRIENYSSSNCAPMNPCEITFVHTSNPGAIPSDGSTTVTVTAYNAMRKKYATASILVSWKKTESIDNKPILQPLN